jgi:Zn ribbon nucleic-acid-binding protein
MNTQDTLTQWRENAGREKCEGVACMLTGDGHPEGALEQAVFGHAV